MGLLGRHGLGHELAEVEVLAPAGDLVALPLEDPHHGQLDQAAVGLLEDVDPFGDHGRAVGEHREDLELDDLQAGGEHLDHAADGLVAGEGIDGDVVVHAVLGEVAHHPVEVGVGPCRAEVLHQLLVVVAVGHVVPLRRRGRPSRPNPHPRAHGPDAPVRPPFAALPAPL